MEEIKRSYLFPLPLDPEAAEAVETWETTYNAECTGLMLRFAKMHLAINAQKSGAGLEALKRLYSAGEDEMMDWYLELSMDVLNVLRGGYGGSTVVARYYAIIKEVAKHQASYRNLRRHFDAFMDE